MIPLRTTRKPEAAVNLMLKYFRHVLIASHYDNNLKIRFRPDLIRDDRVFFGKVPSQIKRWREQGGCLVSWRRVDALEGEHDAILFTECPKSLDAVSRGMALTASLAVIYLPPTWKAHEDTINARQKDAPEKRIRHLNRLKLLSSVLEDTPVLTRTFLEKRFSPLAPSRSSPVPAQPEAVAPLSDKGR